MSTESIIILAIVIAAAVAVAAWQLRKKKANPASPPGAGQGDFGGGS